MMTKAAFQIPQPEIQDSADLEINSSSSDQASGSFNDDPSDPVNQPLGDYACAVFAKQYRRLVKQEKGVLQDQDPEHLHQMRVATRRLRTALQVFGSAVHLPKPARERQVQALTRTLGQLRDLDVQIASLQDHYRPTLPAHEQKCIDRAIAKLHKQRGKVFATVQATLTGPTYHNLKTAYDGWLKQPAYSALAQLPLRAVLADLLSPLLAKLLLNPGWLVAAADHSSESGIALHELRKVCKQARYQAEFFTDCYGSAFQNWLEELKQIQENLGVVQDTHVLLELLVEKGVDLAELPQLQEAVDQQRQEALADWDETRARYTDAAFRQSLYQMILQPN
jgi:CHAD domain-containing protein